MTGRGITIVGLGPAGAEYLTREAWAHLEQCDEIWLRTKFHPAVAGLPEVVQVRSFDEVYDSSDDIGSVLETIVQQVLELGKREQGVTYGVPGSPFVAEETVSEVMKAVAGSGLPIRLIDGVSFIEPVCSALGIDLHPQMVLADALHIAQLEVPSFPPTIPALISQLDSSFEASELKLTLMANYPQDHSVMLVHNAGTSDEIIEKLALYEIDQSVHLGMLTCLYVPALSQGTSFEDFQQIIARLRRYDGCPWDREQTHLSLRPYLLEEAYEVLEALDQEDSQHLREELGDLMLQIGLHTQIATEDEDFLMSDVLQGINSKLIRRHPHVFSDIDVDSVDNVLTNWEKIKADERKTNGESHKGMLEGIPLSLPALTQADQIQRRAKRVGFDWHTIEPVIAKVHEELGELRDAQTDEERQAEAGDVLFAVVNLVRWLKVDPEIALRETNLRFRKRFGFIEKKAAEQGKSVDQLSFEEMDQLWEAAKVAFKHEADEESGRG